MAIHSAYSFFLLGLSALHISERERNCSRRGFERFQLLFIVHQLSLDSRQLFLDLPQSRRRIVDCLDGSKEGVVLQWERLSVAGLRRFESAWDRKGERTSAALDEISSAIVYTLIRMKVLSNILSWQGNIDTQDDVNECMDKFMGGAHVIQARAWHPT
jgi:hypothetical protein